MAFQFSLLICHTCSLISDITGNGMVDCVFFKYCLLRNFPPMLVILYLCTQFISLLALASSFSGST